MIEDLVSFFQNYSLTNCRCVNKGAGGDVYYTQLLSILAQMIE